MRVVIIGGTGHVGTYLVPRLVEAGHELININRRQRPYHKHAAWKKVQMISMDRSAEEAAGAFGRRVADLKADVVIDMIGYTLDNVRSLVESLRGEVYHYVFCGTLWVHGAAVVVPIPETAPRHPIGEYGIAKAQIEAWLHEEARAGFPASIVHPGHIVVPGWTPVNPQGNFNPAVFERLARGQEITLPHLGLETLQHVHADDVAQGFMLVIEHRNQALGESFHIATPTALTWRGYAEAVAAWFGHEAKLRFLPWEEWKAGAAPVDAIETERHLMHSTFCSIEKARRVLGYQPRYTPLEVVRESLDWLIEHKVVKP
jgi:nucleoside-diphosphate-sugar epimerase